MKPGGRVFFCFLSAHLVIVGFTLPRRNPCLVLRFYIKIVIFSSSQHTIPDLRSRNNSPMHISSFRPLRHDCWRRIMEHHSYSPGCCDVSSHVFLACGSLREKERHLCCQFNARGKIFLQAMYILIFFCSYIQFSIQITCFVYCIIIHGIHVYTYEHMQ